MTAFGPVLSGCQICCNVQINDDLKNPVPYGDKNPNGKRALAISHCRACEEACLVRTYMQLMDRVIYAYGHKIDLPDCQ